MQNFIEIEETFCGWTDVHRTYARTDEHLRLALLNKLCQRVILNRQLLSVAINLNRTTWTFCIHCFCSTMY